MRLRHLVSSALGFAPGVEEAGSSGGSLRRTGCVYG